MTQLICRTYDTRNSARIMRAILSERLDRQFMIALAIFALNRPINTPYETIDL